MKFSVAAALSLLAASNAALVTEVVHVTQFLYEDVHVYVDNSGNPVSTQVDLVSTNVPVSEATSAPAAAASSHSHTPNAPYLINVSSEPTTTVSITTQAAATSSSEAPSSEAPAPTTTSISTPPAVTTTSTTSTVNTPSTTSTSSTSSPAPVTTSSPPAPATTSSSAPAPATSSAAAPTSSSSGGDGQTFSGQGTYYDVGLGACGWTNTDADLIAALNVEQFGAQSNGNPVCGKYALVQYQDKSVKVEITDKCPGCKYGDLDLSPAAFQQLADESLGRIDITWSFV